MLTKICILAQEGLGRRLENTQ